MRALVIGAAMLCSVTNTGRSVCGDQEFALVLRHQVRIDARADELDRTYLCREEAAGGAPERICRCRTRALALRLWLPC